MIAATAKSRLAGNLSLSAVSISDSISSIVRSVPYTGASRCCFQEFSIVPEKYASKPVSSISCFVILLSSWRSAAKGIAMRVEEPGMLPFFSKDWDPIAFQAFAIVRPNYCLTHRLSTIPFSMLSILLSLAG